jgi:hypothetical protein
MLSPNTHVFVVAFNNGTQHWLVKNDTKRDERTGHIVLWPHWGKPEEAKSMAFEFAQVFRRRMLEEHMQETHFALSAGSSEFVEEPNSSAAQGQDTRQVMQYKGLLVSPGYDSKSGERCWYVKTFDGPMQLESVRGATPEEAVDRTYERNLQHKAQQAPPPPQAAAQQPAAPAGPRIRPGSLR